MNPKNTILLPYISNTKPASLEFDWNNNYNYKLYHLIMAIPMIAFSWVQTTLNYTDTT